MPVSTESGIGYKVKDEGSGLGYGTSLVIYSGDVRSH